MPQYQIRIQRTETMLIESPSVEQAARMARSLVSADKALKLLDVVRIDLVETETEEGKTA